MFLPYDLVVRGLDTDAPAPQTAVQVNPTLLVSWWCTGFSLVIILVRLCGRYIRTEKLFKEDKIMALSIIPLLGRMALVHVIIKWGTNNVNTVGLSAEDIWRREVGSKLVLPARILYAGFLWTCKTTISEFLKRTYSQMWKKTYQVGLQAIRWFLVVTFIGIIISTLAECQPFDHYWQVFPDPGPHCRQGYAQLLTMGAANILTDFTLVAFPVSIVFLSNMRLQRKISLSLLFGLSLNLVGITIYRVYSTTEHNSDQPYRSLMASLEILAAAAVSNALVLGSFVRDRGVKKAKFKLGSTGGESSLDRPTMLKSRPRGALSWGSDIDLVGDLGMRLGPEFSRDKSTVARPAPAVLPLGSPSSALSPPLPNWSFPRRESVDSDETDLKTRQSGFDSPLSPTHSYEQPSILTPRRMSFFDVGGLLGNDGPRSGPRSRTSSNPSSQNILMQPLLGSSSRQKSPRGTRVLLDDMGAMPEARLSRSTPSRSSPSRSSPPRSSPSRSTPSPHTPSPDRSFSGI